jgi:hypothetical protein
MRLSGGPIEASGFILDSSAVLFNLSDAWLLAGWKNRE